MYVYLTDENLRKKPHHSVSVPLDGREVEVVFCFGRGLVEKSIARRITSPLATTIAPDGDPSKVADFDTASYLCHRISTCWKDGWLGPARVLKHLLIALEGKGVLSLEDIDMLIADVQTEGLQK